MAIDYSSGDNARALVKGKTTVVEIMKELEDFYRPRGLATYSSLCKRLREISLTDFKNVSEYTDAFTRINNELKHLGSIAEVPEPFLIQQYLRGLGDQYSSFEAIYNQMKDFSFDEEKAKKNPTLQDTARAALDEEQRLLNKDGAEPTQVAMLASSTVPANIRGSTVAIGKPKQGRLTLEVDYCERCNMIFHNLKSCKKVSGNREQPHHKG